MAGVVIENLSTKKLLGFVAVLLVLQIVCFLVGGLIAPSPSAAHMHLATKCIDPAISINKPFVPHGPNACSKVSTFDEATVKGIEADWIVFAIMMPHPPNHMDRSFQYMIGVMSLDITYSRSKPMGENPELTLVIQMFASNSDEAEKDWHLLYSVNETRKMSCEFMHEKIPESEGHSYDCEPIPLFELGTVHHKYYLVNVRLPVWEKVSDRYSNKIKELNVDLGAIQDLSLIEIHQNGGFTLVWLTIKTAMFPLVILAMIWFWKRIVQLARPPLLIERTILALAITVSILNLPLEWLTFFHEMTYMLLLSDIRQGATYAMLFSFWIIFVGEHMMDQQERNRLKVYWRQVGAMTLGCFCLFIFDVVERGVQLRNPFYSIWNTETGRRLALIFVILAGICGFLYTIFLIFMVWGVFKNISMKRAALPHMMAARRLHYEGLIYRFRFFMFFTLICAIMTAVFFIFSQINEGNWKWGEDEYNVQYSSAFFTGVYGMWNNIVDLILSVLGDHLFSLQGLIYRFQFFMFFTLICAIMTTIFGLIYRFRFFMFFTLICAIMTAVFFIFSQINEGNWKWGEDEYNVQYSSAFFTGVYGMWNIYVLAVLVLYAPSHKNKDTIPNGDTSDGSQVEFEMSTNMSSVNSGPSTSTAAGAGVPGAASSAAAQASTSEVYQLLGKVAND